MKRIILLILILNCFVFNICFSSEDGEWFLKKTYQDKLFIYGVGSSLNLDNAVEKALNNITNYILVSSKLEENLNEEIIFPSYDIGNTKNVDNDIYVFLSIKKNELYNLYRDKLLDLDKKINNDFENAKGKDNFTRLNVFKKIEKDIFKVKSYIQLLKFLDYFNEKNFIKNYNSILEEFEILKQNLDLKIETSDSFSEKIVSGIKEYFVEQNVKISEESKNILKISSDLKKTFIEKEYLVDLNINFKLFFEDKIVRYKSMEFKQQSLIDYNDAFGQIVYDIYETVKKESLLDFR